MLLRAPAGAEPSSMPLGATLARVDPRIQVRDVMPLEAVGSEDRAVFAGIGAALTALGGIARVQVLRSVMGRASVPLVIGTLAGYPLGGVLVAARGIFAFRLPADSGPWGMPALCALMIAAGLAASWLPARRALRVPTSDALRAE